MAADQLSDQTITLTAEDGRAYPCRILGVFEFEEKEYALLHRIGDGEDEGGTARTVIMRLIEQEDQAVFRTIESDAEFERVTAYVKELAQEMEGSN
jgi:uncharacterized protein YrzB (UPF0473 family)